jgi:hypothetical protein
MSAFAQQDGKMMSFNDQTTEELSKEAKSFYTDQAKKTCYIDFQSLSVNLNAILLKDASGNVLREEKVFDLPVDTIYELDLSAFQSGAYEIELQSFSKVIKKTVVLK